MMQAREMTEIGNYTEPRVKVEGFLEILHRRLCAPGFDASANIDILYYDKGKSPDDPHTTKNTMLALDFEVRDVAYELEQLSVDEYMMNVIDDKPGQTRPFYVFCRSVANRLIYIKLKLREKDGPNSIFVVSFHFDDFEGETKRYPYRE